MDTETETAIRNGIRSVLAGERFRGYFGDTIDACTRAVVAELDDLAEQRQHVDVGSEQSREQIEQPLRR